MRQIGYGTIDSGSTRPSRMMLMTSSCAGQHDHLNNRPRDTRNENMANPATQIAQMKKRLDEVTRVAEPVGALNDRSDPPGPDGLLL